MFVSGDVQNNIPVLQGNYNLFTILKQASWREIFVKPHQCGVFPPALLSPA
jgi:hypothetical protein